MDVHKKLLLASLSCVLLIQVASSDGTAEGVGTTSWTCVCTAHPLGEPNSNSSLSSNCSSSCHCLQDDDGGTGSWNCTCASDKALKKEHTAVHDRGCFTSCNCTSGITIQIHKLYCGLSVQMNSVLTECLNVYVHMLSRNFSGRKEARL
jgi:hypothetical protein